MFCYISLPLVKQRIRLTLLVPGGFLGLRRTYPSRQGFVFLRREGNWRQYQSYRPFSLLEAVKSAFLCVYKERQVEMHLQRPSRTWNSWSFSFTVWRSSSFCCAAITSSCDSCSLAEDATWHSLRLSLRFREGNVTGSLHQVVKRLTCCARETLIACRIGGTLQCADEYHVPDRRLDFDHLRPSCLN